MNTTVDFQAPLSFEVWPIILLACLLVGAVAFFIIKMLVEKMKAKKKQQLLEEEERKKKPVVVKPTLDELKNKYLTQIAVLENKYRNNQIADREAYEELSNLFRTFVYDATGTPAHKYTLYDMRGLDKPIIYNLVNNYYAPEFSKNTKGNILESIEFTKRAIYEWN